MTFSATLSIFVTLLFELLCLYVWLQGKKNPESKLLNLLYTPFGPRTDIAFMTRKELFQSAWIFLKWGFHCCFLISVGVLCLSVYYGDKEPDMVAVILPGFLLVIPCCMFFAATGYLLVRGLFRRKIYNQELIKTLRDNEVESDHYIDN